jgi:glucosamine-6-phosphate deaminase
MKLINVNNSKELSKRASEIIINEVNDLPDLTIAFATGKTPLGLYRMLAKECKKDTVDFSKIKAFNLDEYYPIIHEDKRSFSYYLFKNLFNKINAKKENITLLNGDAKYPDSECKRYEGKLRKNRPDIMILGVGKNGHIAFNEPGSSKNSITRIIKLSKETIRANSPVFHKIPDHALTIGIKTILSSKKIILLASGKSKADAIKHLIHGKPDKRYPVTFLKVHKNLIVIVDKGAGKLLS